MYKVYLLIGKLLSLLLLYTHYSPKSKVFLIIFIKFYTFLTNHLLAYKQHLKRHHFGQDIEFAAKILYQTDKTCQKPKKIAKKCHLLKLTLLFRCKNKHKMIFLHKSKLFDQISCVCVFFVVPLQRIQWREAGESPAQSRCCDSQSNVRNLESHWFSMNWEGWTSGAISQKTCCV